MDIQNLDRKVIRKADFSDFNAFITSVLNGFNVDRDTAEEYKHQLFDLHDRYGQYIRYIEVIAALQVLIQPESLIQQDRLAYLTQHGVDAQLVPVFEENISPRNIALVANKSI